MWAAPDDQAVYLPDIQKLEKFLESKCKEPIRSGLDKRSAHIILIKRIYEGEQFSQRGLDYSKRRVNALGFFDKVEVTTKRGSSDDTMDVNVEVGERQTGAFQIGAGFSSVESFIFQAQISQNNLLGRGTSATLQAQVSGLRQLYMFQYEDPYFFDTNWTFGFNLFNQQRYYLGFTRKATGGSLTWGYMLADNIRMFLTYTLQDVGVATSGRSNLFTGGQRSPLPAGSLANLLHSGILSSWRSLHGPRYARRPHVSAPRLVQHGLRGICRAGLFLAKPVHPLRRSAIRYYYPLRGPLTLRLKAESGLITSRDPQGVPIFERYFVGGIYDVRGFALYSLGTKIAFPARRIPIRRSRPSRSVAICA